MSFFIGTTSKNGRLDTFAQILNCTFRGNVADEFGAAIDAVTENLFSYTEDIMPVEITDW